MDQQLPARYMNVLKAAYRAAPGADDTFRIDTLQKSIGVPPDEFSDIMDRLYEAKLLDQNSPLLVAIGGELTDAEIEWQRTGRFYAFVTKSGREAVRNHDAAESQSRKKAWVDRGWGFAGGIGTALLAFLVAWAANYLPKPRETAAGNVAASTSAQTGIAATQEVGTAVGRSTSTAKDKP